MEGFGKPPLPPPPPTPSSSRCHNANQENGNTTDDASAEIPKTQEVSRAAEVPVDPDHEKKLKRYDYGTLYEYFFLLFFLVKKTLITVGTSCYFHL